MTAHPDGRPFVADDGPRSARIVVIGEAPGQHEEARGVPFVGPSGWRLAEWLSAVGLRRRDCYLTNVYPYRPRPTNDIANVPADELATWTHRLHDRLAALDGPHVLVPTGNTALQALVGRRHILADRGFIDAYTDRRGRTIKVIPTIHPAATFRTPGWVRRCLVDWRKIAHEATFPDVRLPEWEHVINPTRSDLEAFVADAARDAEALSVDIETFGGSISCVGFAYAPDWSLTIPTSDRYWRSPADLDAAWQAVRTLCALPCAKVLQTGLYDAYWLAEHGVTLVNWQWDCYALHHALDAADEHSLSYMASVELRMRPWKHIPKDDAARTRFPSDFAAIQTYCGIDNVVQWLLADRFAARLAQAGRLDFYREHYRDLFPAMGRLMRRGIAVDRDSVAARALDVQARVRALQARLLEATGGHDLRGTTARRSATALPDLSAKRVAAFLYETLRLPRQERRRKTGRTTVSADEVAVRKVRTWYATRVVGRRTRFVVPDGVDVLGVCDTILEHRRQRKILEFLDLGKVDADGRMRASFGFAPETGRLSSSANPKGTGRNVQNIDRDPAVRAAFVPDPGCLFLEVDLSQAEDRIVKACAASLLLPGPRRDDLLWRARAQPWENDEHWRAAEAIYGQPRSALSKTHRYFAKRARHAANYNMGGKRLAEELSKEGYTITPDEGQQMIEAVVERDVPEVRLYQREIRRLLMAHRRLVNSWGRELRFDYDRLDDDTYRRGYAFIPQSSVPAILNLWGFRPLDAAIEAGQLRAAINNNVHDSLLVSVPPEAAWDVWQFLAQALTRPQTYWGVELTVPATLKLGLSWAFQPGVEFDRPPDRPAFERAVAELWSQRPSS